jgi:hypothetical protein
MPLILTMLLTLAITNTAVAQTKLSWESKNPANSEWTSVALKEIERQYPTLNIATDMNLLCPNYYNMEMEKRIMAWGELFSAVALYESNWNPHSQYTEHTLGIDQVTGKILQSEGLLQLSYTDTRWAKWCRFDWEYDKNINDPSKITIMDPKNNLECGIGIMANQIKRTQKVLLDKGAYWSTLKLKGQRNKINEVSRMIVARIPQCAKP